MNKRKINQHINQGSYRTIATIKLNREKENTMLLSNFFAMANYLRATHLKISSGKNNPDLDIAVSGIENAVLEQVTILTESDEDHTQEFTIINELGEVEISLILSETDQGSLIHDGDLNESIKAELEEKFNNITDNIIESVNAGNRIAEIAVTKTLEMQDIKDMVQDLSDQKAARHVVALATGPELIIQLPNQTLTVGGGRHIPRKYSINNSSLLNDCSILNISPKGRMLIMIPNSNQDLLDIGAQRKGKEFIVELRQDSKDMQILQFADAAKLQVDLWVMLTEHVATGRPSCSLIEIKDRMQLYKSLFSRLKEVIEES